MLGPSCAKKGVIPFMYLGFPLGAISSRRKTWDPILRKVISKLSRWNNRFLSIAGRVTLIKAVLVSLPIFFMSLLKISKAVVHRPEALFRRFMWGGLDNNRKIHFVSWATVCKPSCLGGLGIINLREMNDGLLLKWI